MAAGCGISQGPTAGRAATATQAGSPSPQLSSASPSNQVLLTADSGPADPGTGPGWRFQIRYPSTYTMTPDSAFGTGGSVAPPRMSLTIGFQPVAPNPSYGQTQHDCILVWSTYQFSSISEWEGSLSSTAPPSVSPETTPRVVTENRQRVGALDVLIREVTDPSTSTHRFEAFVELGAPTISPTSSTRATTIRGKISSPSSKASPQSVDHCRFRRPQFLDESSTWRACEMSSTPMTTRVSVAR
jgi:hypothetical protein